MGLREQFIKVRQQTESICGPLETEDYVVQPIANVSPPKWHLAHTSWFFEQFVLVEYDPSYQVFHPDFGFLFNSYYNNMGERTLRQNRGMMTRPTVAKVYEYRHHVTEAIGNLLKRDPGDQVVALVEVGINHEQQHQELLAYDIKYILGNQPTFPPMGGQFALRKETWPQEWFSFPEGVYEIGHKGDSFCFDNELPVHKCFVPTFHISNKLVTNGEYMGFIADGGYDDFNLWHDEGWHFVRDNGLGHPLYWHFRNGEWWYYHFNGLEKVNPRSARNTYIHV